MTRSKLIARAALNALGAVAYIALVALVPSTAETIFGNIDAEPMFLGPLLFLLLFVLSAAITGSLVLGKPILLYLDGAKADAVKLFLYTILFMLIALVAVFLTIATTVL